MSRTAPVVTDAFAGTLHEPDRPSGEALALTHGAGGSSDYPLLVRLAESFAADGARVLRCDLPSTRRGHTGLIPPALEEIDRESMRAALRWLRPHARRVVQSGHSYGARQSTLIAAEDPSCCDALVLLSYSLFHPDRPDEPRSAHFPALRVPTLSVHGDHDPYGTLGDMQTALARVPAKTALLPVVGAGHDLFRGDVDLFPAIRRALDALTAARPA